MNQSQKRIISSLLAIMVGLSFNLSVKLENRDNPLFFTPKTQPLLGEGETYQVHYFTSLPSNPVTSEDLLTYKDLNLTTMSEVIEADQSLDINAIYYNDKQQAVFQLSNGDYALASHQMIYDDIIYYEKTIDSDYWLNDEFTIYESPYRKGVSTKKTNLSSGNKITVVSEAETAAGIFYALDDGGWINAEEVSSEDNRMTLLQEQLDKKYGKNKNISVYVYGLETGESASLHEDTVYYAASVAKLPILYYTQKQIDDGEIKLSKKLKYTEKVNDFSGAYDPEGSGNISKVADNESYTVEDVMKAVAQNSDNVGSNLLAYYITNQYDKTFYETIKSETGVDWSMKTRETTVKDAAMVMKALYEQDGKVLDYLSETAYDTERIAKNIPVQVAHKIGDAYDFKHDVAIVYAKEPFIISVFTDQSTYDDITDIADMAYKLLK